MKFKSKIDWWFHLVVLFCVAMSILPVGLGFAINSTITIIISAIIMIVLMLVILPIYFFTFYVLEDTTLHIRSGLCINKRISYDDIKSVVETRDPSASAALSLDRIQIGSSSIGVILISPKGKQEFLRLLNQRTA